MSKPFRELTKDWSIWRRLRVWIEKQKIKWNLRRAYKANYEMLEKEAEVWDYVSVEGILENTEWNDEENMKLMEEFREIDRETWAMLDE